MDDPIMESRSNDLILSPILCMTVSVVVLSYICGQRRVASSNMAYYWAMRFTSE